MKARSELPEVLGALVRKGGDWLDRALEARRTRRRATRARPRADFDDPLLRATLWQHPVGQGLFHSGMIRMRGRTPFRYVYDCGKKPRGNWMPLVGPAVAAYGPRPLDALFISHFDSDHVNGLTELLAGFGGAEVAFLPYLTPVSRLMLAIREEERGARLGGDDLRFLDNPVTSLVDRGVKKVVLVHGSDGDGSGPPNALFFPEGDGEGGLVYESGSTRPSVMTEAEEQALRDALARRAKPHALAFMDHRWPLVLRGELDLAWVFQTHVDPDIEMERLVRDEVRNALGPAVYDDVAAGQVGCSAILADTVERGKLKQAYKEATGLGKIKWSQVPFLWRGSGKADDSRMNRTTLSLFSGPVQRPDGRALAGIHRMSMDGAAPVARAEPLSDARHGWLLLGDAVLADRNVLDRLVRFFGEGPERYLARTLVFTLPHHGSRRNFSEETLRRLGCPHVAVVPAGNRTHFEHPHREVMDLLEEFAVERFHVHADVPEGLLHDLVVPDAPPINPLGRPRRGR